MTYKILIVDDTPEIVDGLQMLLEIEGYIVIGLTDGNAVIQFMQEQPPDLLLLDIWLSGCNGKDLCLQIKEQEALRHIPLLLMSAHRTTPEIAQYAGADGYLLKPFIVNTLLATIASALQKQQKE
jgi:DNA-binding response OmpR family regulator